MKSAHNKKKGRPRTHLHVLPDKIHVIKHHVTPALPLHSLAFFTPVPLVLLCLSTSSSHVLVAKLPKLLPQVVHRLAEINLRSKCTNGVVVTHVPMVLLQHTPL